MTHQTAVGVFRESYTDEARFQRAVTGIPQHSDRDYSMVVVLPDLYPHDLGRVVDGRRSRP
eukprot:4636301-Pleurochrysis_carterae.AAC.1